MANSKTVRQGSLDVDALGYGESIFQFNTTVTRGAFDFSVTALLSGAQFGVAPLDHRGRYLSRTEGVRCRPSQGSPLQPFAQQIILDRQIPDLGMQLFDFRFGRPLGLATTGKHIGHAFDSLTLPRTDLVRMHLLLRGDLLERLVASQRFQRHLGIELVGTLSALRYCRITSKVQDTV